MTNRTFVMAGGLILAGGVTLLIVLQMHGRLTERRAQRAVEEAMEAEAAAIREATFRRTVLTDLFLAANNLPWTDRIDTLCSKLIAAQRGERTDPKIEAMVEAMLEVFHDETLPADERLDAMDRLANKLVREYRP